MCSDLKPWGHNTCNAKFATIGAFLPKVGFKIHCSTWNFDCSLQRNSNFCEYCDIHPLEAEERAMKCIVMQAALQTRDHVRRTWKCCILMPFLDAASLLVHKVLPWYHPIHLLLADFVTAWSYSTLLRWVSQPQDCKHVAFADVKRYRPWWLLVTYNLSYYNFHTIITPPILVVLPCSFLVKTFFLWLHWLMRLQQLRL